MVFGIHLYMVPVVELQYSSVYGYMYTVYPFAYLIICIFSVS
jgi:hypothetical protein